MLNLDVSHSILIEELREKTSMRGLMSLVEKNIQRKNFHGFCKTGQIQFIL